MSRAAQTANLVSGSPNFQKGMSLAGAKPSFMRHQRSRPHIIVGWQGGVMSFTGKFLMTVGVGVILCGNLSAQGLVMQRNLSLGMAKTTAEATISECKAKG